MPTPEGIFTVRLLPSDPSGIGLLRAHIEAHDHLAVVTEAGDGSAVVQGPAGQADEISAVCDELAVALRLHRVR